jgi:uncharacterized membrane protein
VERLSAVLARMAERSDPARLRLDEEGRLRVIAQATTFEEVLRGSFDPIRLYGSNDPNVMVVLLESLAEVIRRAGDAQRAAVALDVARGVHAAAGERCSFPADRARLDAALQAVEQAS